MIGVHGGFVLWSLRVRGVVREAEMGGFWLDEDAAREFRRGQQHRIAVIAAFAVLLLLLYALVSAL
jgi:hypothetical protein